MILQKGYDDSNIRNCGDLTVRCLHATLVACNFVFYVLFASSNQ